VDRKTEADSIFNLLYDNYKTENIANAAAIQLKKPLINLSYDPADELYLDAEEKLIEKNYSESVTKFYSIFQNYPKSPLAPKALYAGGWILENDLKLYDSAAVFYDSLNVIYPQTQYASSVKLKLTIYKQEIDKRNKAIEDSLKQIELKNLEVSKVDSLEKSVIPEGEVPKEQLQTEEILNDESDEETDRRKSESNEVKKPGDTNDIKEPEKPNTEKIK
jgi:tetratricopeptide (TPR) repeat protein